MKIAVALSVVLAFSVPLAAQTSVPMSAERIVDYPPSVRPSLDRGEYRVGQDDVLEIVVFEIPELGITARVTASGYVSLPLIGAVKVFGMTTLELATQLEDSLRENYVIEPHVTVLIREYASQPVSIIGAVKTPGIYQIKGQKRLLDMLSMAQGLAPNPGSTIQVIRASAAMPVENDAATPPGMVAIDIEELLEQGKTELNIPIYAGDVINVLQAGSVFIVGELNSPNQYVLRNGRNVTVTQAVALGGGFAQDAKPEASMIIRVHLDGTREEIPVDTEKIFKGEAEDVTMLSNDILFVPASKSKPWLRRALETTIGMATGTLTYGLTYGRRQ